mmetsp:Transcript_29818/g.62726  ORF Transcript_29818/g.62726 Transcript_29818/m.62726 type:complete len:254 (+) Transcript_29818:459-1220(+)
MNFQNMPPSLKVRKTKLHLPIQTPRTQEGRVKGIRSIRRHEHFDISTGVEPIQLGNDLKHGALHLVVGSVVVSAATCSTDGVDFVEEDDTGAFGAGHGEELADHPGSFSDVFLDEFGADDADETSVGSVGYGSGRKSFASSWRPVEQHSLWRLNPQCHKPLWMKQRRLKHLPQFFQCIFCSAYVVIRDIWFVFHGHEAHGRINLGRQRNLNRIFRSVHTHTHALFNIRRGHLLSQSHHKFGNLFHVDNVLAPR